MRTARYQQAASLLVVLMAIAGGGALRMLELDIRPMHADEAVHAVKFGPLLEEGYYRYDPHEYHGPSLNYLTLPIVLGAGARRLSDISATHLRLLPAVFGILLIALVWLLREQLGSAATAVAAALTAASPALVFYSRYYIQEMLLTTFALAAIASFWRWIETDDSAPAKRAGSWRSRFPPGAAWLLALGLWLGMMHATKETCVIAGFSMAVAAVVSLGGRSCSRRLPLRGVLIVLVAAGAVSVVFFSSFFQHPRGVVDSVATYGHYLQRAGGEGSAGPHVHPWYQYLNWLFWQRGGEGRLWTEAAIAALALPGLIAAATGLGLEPRRVPFARFAAVYAVTMLLVYSAIPYKTPWCAAGPLHGLILVAGIGAGALLRWVSSASARLAVTALIAAAVMHLGWQAWTASFLEFEHPQSPHVYAHTTGDVAELADRIERIAASHPDGWGIIIQIVCPRDDYWPLPWYLRRFSHVGWYRDEPAGPPAPLIITQPELEPMLLQYLYVRQPPGQRPLYVPVAPEDRAAYYLRPHVPLRVYAQLELWQTHLERDDARPQGTKGT